MTQDHLPPRYIETRAHARQVYGDHYPAIIRAVMIQIEGRSLRDGLSMIDAGLELQREAMSPEQALIIIAAMVELTEGRRQPVTDEMILAGAGALTGILDGMGITLSPAEAEIHAKGVLAAALAGEGPLGPAPRDAFDAGDQG